MRKTNRFLLTVGVALCVAPIFSLAHAQQGNAQARMLLEMQQMRQEIAELRDMIERQQYQIRKMQQAQARQATSGGRPVSTYPSQTYPAAQQPGTTYSDPVGVGQTYPQTGAQPQGTASQPGAYPQSGAQQSDEQFYRPYNPGAEVPANTEVSANEPRPYGSGQVVEERVITAPRSTSGSGDAYPPVVDRSVGSPLPSTQQPVYGSEPSAYSSEPSAGSEPSVYNSEPSAQNQFPNDPQSQSSPAPVYEQPGGQVNQSSGPITSQPIEVIPGAAAGGGVVSIPQSGQIITPEQVAQAGSTPPYSNQQVATTAPVVRPGIPAALSENDYYNQGFDLMKQSKFDEAVEVFKRQIDAYPAGDSADDAHYWIAEAMYVTRNLDVAKTHLKTLIQNFPESRRVPDAMLKAAYIEQQQGNQIEARILFQEIVNYHPKSDAAIAARNRLADSN